jgi:hypothetical protein
MKKFFLIGFLLIPCICFGQVLGNKYGAVFGGGDNVVVSGSVEGASHGENVVVYDDNSESRVMTITNMETGEIGTVTVIGEEPIRDASGREYPNWNAYYEELYDMD